MFNKIISLENLYSAWEDFLRGKRNKKDVQIFSLRLSDNIFALHKELVNKTYTHGSYVSFKISDPKPRDIHKASVRDRLLHHAVYRVLYPYFDKKFIHDSFSCRNNKGTHRALRRFQKYVWMVGKNNTKQCWILKCDIRKFFASIDHKILLSILHKHIFDQNVIWLCNQIITSFETPHEIHKGLPLGNLTSQLFANVYLNELDQFIKHQLRVDQYIRYADDFVIFSQNKNEIEFIRAHIHEFLVTRLRLLLHPDKVFARTIGSGVDFLGWVYFSDHRVLRGTTRKRMFRRLKTHHTLETLNSYRGLLRHGNTHRLQNLILRHPAS